MDSTRPFKCTHNINICKRVFGFVNYVIRVSVELTEVFSYIVGQHINLYLWNVLINKNLFLLGTFVKYIYAGCSIDKDNDNNFYQI